MAPKSKCPTLTRCGVTSIKVLCQVVHLFGRLDFYYHTLYRLITFKQMVHFLVSISLSYLFFFIGGASSLHSFHCR